MLQSMRGVQALSGAAATTALFYWSGPRLVRAVRIACLVGMLLGTSIVQAQPSPPTGELKSSIGRLQTFDRSGPGDPRSDAQRDLEIQQLLPNFRVLATGSSERGLKEQALKTLQAVELTPSGRQTANLITEKTSLFRRLPEVRFEVDPETYDYFVGHPDVVVGLWKSMGISAINLHEVKQYQYRMQNVDGTVSDLYFIRRSRDSNIIYCDGEFKSPFLKNPIAAKGIFCLYSRFEREPDGTVFVRQHADVFISFPSTAIETAAKLISPVSNYIADRNFQEISLFMHSMSLTMARQPGWVHEQISRIQGVHPAKTQELMHVTMKNYQINQARLAARYDAADSVFK